ncbi:MAG: carbohydrate binding domain-containing protein, partial [Planctomycetota bacterium]
MSAPATHRRRMPGHADRRAGIYVAILSIAVIVSLIGISALTLARRQLQGIGMNESAARADVYAQSVIDLAGLYLASPTWRSTYVHDTWSTPVDVGDGLLSFKLVDETDANLADSSDEPVRLYGKAVCGDATRLYSVRLQPRTRPNLLSNGDFEGGTTNWSGSGCLISVRSDTPHGGSSYLYVYNRLNWYNGPVQTVTSSMRAAHNYDLEAWATVEGPSRSIVALLEVVSSYDGTQYFSSSSPAVGPVTWTRVNLS